MTGRPPYPWSIVLVAGEPSADLLGARLMAALREEADGPLSFAGVGGPRMAEEGLESLFPYEELGLMGFVEVLPHVPRLLRRLASTARTVRALAPRAVVTIDSPGFTLRLLRRLRGIEAPRVHYVAPQVWAWRRGRAVGMGRDVDHLLALLPFEPAFFARHGLSCECVGHPIVEEMPERPDGDGFRRRHGIASDAPLVCLLPGSRAREVEAHLPVLRDAMTELAAETPGLAAVLPTLPAREAAVRAAVAGWPSPVVVTIDRAARFDAYAASRVAVAASGTVALELALAGCPMVTIYRTHPATAWLARRLIRVPYVNLVNLIAGREIAPELLQEACTPGNVAAELRRRLADDDLRRGTRSALASVARLLGDGREPPSRRAARAILTRIAGDGASGVRPA